MSSQRYAAEACMTQAALQLSKSVWVSGTYQLTCKEHATLRLRQRSHLQCSGMGMLSKPASNVLLCS